jgi:hypothetical protein
MLFHSEEQEEKGINFTIRIYQMGKKQATKPSHFNNTRRR